MAIEQLTGQLTLRLHWQPGQIVAVELQSNRLRLNSRLFAGKPVMNAPNVIGLLFSLCGTAQRIAAARAAAQALGQAYDPPHRQQQDWQIHSEMLFEHLLRLSQDWQHACAQPPLAAHDLQALFKLKGGLQQAANPALLQHIGAWLETHLLGLPMQRWLTYCEVGNDTQLASHGAIGRLFSRIQQRQWQALGDQPLHALSPLPVSWWQQRLSQTDAEQFCATPTLAGQPCETSVLTRQWQHPCLQVWRARYGTGLITRLLARVLDLLEVWQNLVNSPVTCIKQVSPCKPAAPSGTGTAAVPTARGLLVHQVTQQHGLLTAYHIVAPTEWNFHPQGTLYRMLMGLNAMQEAELRAQAQALIVALDPCVAHQLEVQRA